MALLKLLEHLRYSFLTDLNMVFTVMGEDLLIIAVFCLIFWCINKKLSYRICFISILSSLFVFASNITLRIQYPFQKDSTLKAVSSAKKITSGYAFPCKNIPFISSIMISLSLNMKKIYLKLLCIVPILLLTFSYLYLGIFSPYDIGIALVITIFFSVLLYHVFNNYSLDKSHRKWIIICFMGSAIILTFYCLYIIYSNQDVSFSDLSDLFKFVGFAIAFIPCWYIETSYIQFSETGATLPVQIAKWLLGLDIAYAIKFGFQYLFEFFNINDAINNFVTYICITIFTIVIYPYVIKNIFSNKLQAYRRH